MRFHHAGPASAGPVSHGRGGVRTCDLSRVKSDKKVDKKQETPGGEQNPGDVDQARSGFYRAAFRHQILVGSADRRA